MCPYMGERLPIYEHVVTHIWVHPLPIYGLAVAYIWANARHPPGIFIPQFPQSIVRLDAKSLAFLAIVFMRTSYHNRLCPDIARKKGIADEIRSSLAFNDSFLDHRLECRVNGRGPAKRMTHPVILGKLTHRLCRKRRDKKPLQVKCL